MPRKKKATPAVVRTDADDDTDETTASTTAPTPISRVSTAPSIETTTSATITASNSTLIKEQLVNSFAEQATSREIEVVFAFDTTGSMYAVFKEVKANLKEMVTRLLKDVPGIRIGLAAVGDYCDSHDTYVVEMQDLCNDVDKLVNWVEKVEKTSGGDTPECYEFLLKETQKLSWKCPNRALVVIGDAPPHEDSYTDQNIYWGDELNKLIKMGIKVYGVYASVNNVVEESQDFYKELSERSGGIFLEMKQFKLIVDMFLAVCYKEFGNEGQLEQFRKEVETNGRMTNDSESIFSALKRGPSELKQTTKEKEYVWWKKNAKTPCRFVLKPKGKWSACKFISTTTTACRDDEDEDKEKEEKKRSYSGKKRGRKVKSRSLSTPTTTTTTTTKTPTMRTRSRKTTTPEAEATIATTSTPTMRTRSRKITTPEAEATTATRKTTEEAVKPRRTRVNLLSPKRHSVRTIKKPEAEKEEEEKPIEKKRKRRGSIRFNTPTRRRKTERKVVTEHSSSNSEVSSESEEEKVEGEPKLKRSKYDVLAIGGDYAFKGDNHTVFIGRLLKIKEEEDKFKVQWFEELKKYPGQYTLMPWTDKIPRSSLMEHVKFEHNNHTGMFKLIGKLPSF